MGVLPSRSVTGAMEREGDPLRLGEREGREGNEQRLSSAKGNWHHDAEKREEGMVRGAKILVRFVCDVVAPQQWQGGRL